MENQTGDNTIQRCLYSPSNGVHGLQVLDDDTIKNGSRSHVLMSSLDSFELKEDNFKFY